LATRISNYREVPDIAWLHTFYWQGMQLGSDGYPTIVKGNEQDYYCIGGG
jgi:hypothetical protein